MDEEKRRTIIVAVDDSDHSLHALEWALDVLLINRRPNDRIVALYAKPSHTCVGGPAFVFTADAIDAFERYEQQVASKIIMSVNRICAERNVNAETKVMVGDPRDVIRETVDTLKADLLVMGSHGFGPIKRVFLGSVSDYCAHNVKCPLVIVKNSVQTSSEE